MINQTDQIPDTPQHKQQQDRSFYKPMINQADQVPDTSEHKQQLNTNNNTMLHRNRTRNQK